MPVDMLTTFAHKLAPTLLLVFLLVTCLEVAVDLSSRRRLYDIDDTCQNLLMFFVNRMFGGLAGSMMLAVLSVVEHLVPWKLSGWWSFAVCFLIVDFLYFVQHYCFHRFDWLAAFHVVHHTSEHYNFTTAVRASIFLPLINPIFYVPALLIGCNAMSVVVCFALIQAVQFLLHTQLVGTLGPIEGWLNTPSAHRVHHGNQAIEYHSNLGGVLLIWDRLFGTYLAENKNIVFGIDGFKSGGFVSGQLGPFVSIVRDWNKSYSDNSETT